MEYHSLVANSFIADRLVMARTSDWASISLHQMQRTTADSRTLTGMDAKEYKLAAEFAWDYPGPFTLAVVPGVDDIDGLNHTNNAVYVRWCESVAWAHSETLGLSLADYVRLDRAMTIRRGEYEYLLPGFLGDELLLATWLTGSDGKITLERRFQLVRRRDQATLLRGRWELVCIEMSTSRPRRMPTDFSAAYLAAMVGTPKTRTPVRNNSRNRT
jgi:acyl-CoA thioester hydrolase